jgi:hypothetical protein
MGWKTMDLGFSSEGGGQDHLLFSTASRVTVVSTQSPALLMGVKYPGCAADHLPSPNAKFKNVWNYMSCPAYDFMVCCIIKQDNQKPRATR